MPYINVRKKLIRLKIVYHGPGLSGKTTNLMRLHETFPDDRRGRLIQLDTETERTLFFDYFPANLGALGGFQVRVDFFTVPGQSFYRATRRAVLEGADGVVFVADSSPRREQANLVALKDLQEAMDSRGASLEELPLVFQWNKRDLRRPMTEKTMERMLNPQGLPSFPAIATEGVGIWDTQREVLRQVLSKLRKESPVLQSLTA